MMMHDDDDDDDDDDRKLSRVLSRIIFIEALNKNFTEFST